MSLIKSPPPLQTTFRFSDGGRAVRLVRGLKCPHCQNELIVEDVATSAFGEVVMGCGACALHVLTVA